MKKKSLNCLNCATFRKLSGFNMRKKLLNFLNVAQLRQFSDFFFIVVACIFKILCFESSTYYKGECCINNKNFKHKA